MTELKKKGKRRSLLPHHREHLYHSGLTDATIDASGWFSVTDPREAAELLKWSPDGGLPPVPALAIRYTGCKYGRLRPDHPRYQEDRGRLRATKYEAPVKTPSRIFIPRKLCSGIDDADTPLYLVEGEKKGLAAAQAGLAVAAAPGVYGFHDVEARQQAKKDKLDEWELHADLVPLVLPDRECEIVFDSDIEENPDVLGAAAVLARMLGEAGAKPFITYLPGGKDKVGLDDLLYQLGGDGDELQQVLEENRRPVAPVPALAWLRSNWTSWSPARQRRELYRVAFLTFRLLPPVEVGGVMGWPAWLSMVGDELDLDDRELQQLERLANLGYVPDLPVVEVGQRQLHEVYDDVRDAVVAANEPPAVFRRGGVVVRVGAGERGPEITTLSKDGCYGVTARAAHFVKKDKYDRLVDTKPPTEVGADLFSRPYRELPEIKQVVTSPVFDRDGNLISTQGFHGESGILVQLPPGFVLPPVPDDPTSKDIEQARSLILDHLLVDFPFATQADLSHAVAALLSAIVRPMIAGPTPAQAVDASGPAAGKTLLAKSDAIIITGLSPDVMTLPRSEEEIGKRITAILLAAPQLVIFDNTGQAITSDSLMALLTSDYWTGRVLGISRMVTVANRIIWIVTGNNLEMSKEAARRFIRIRLEPKEERPDERTGFRHDPLLLWVRKNRPSLLVALLTLVRAWLAAGRPPGSAVLASFEEWARIVGGILRVVGIDGFLGNQQQLYETTDAAGQEERALVAAWWKRFKERPVAAGLLLDLAEHQGLLDQVLGDGGITSRRAKMGAFLRKLRGRKFGDAEVIESVDSHTKQKVYRLAKIVAAPPSAAGAAGAPQPEHPHEHPQGKSCDDGVMSGSAGGAGAPSESFSRRDEDEGTDPDGENIRGRANQHPQHPQHPQDCDIDEDSSRVPPAGGPDTSAGAPAPPSGGALDVGDVEAFEVVTAGDLPRAAAAIGECERVGVAITTAPGLIGEEPRIVAIAAPPTVYVFDLFQLSNLGPVYAALRRTKIVVHGLLDQTADLQRALYRTPTRGDVCTFTASVLLYGVGDDGDMHSFPSVLHDHTKLARPSQPEWSGLPGRRHYRAVAFDAAALLPLTDELESVIDEEGLDDVFELECDLVPVLVEMERIGVGVDVDGWRSYVESLEKRLAKVVAALRDDHDIDDVNDIDDVLSALAAEGVDVPNIKSVSLKEHRGEPLVELLLRYRSIKGRLLSVAKPLLAALLRSRDGRLHPRYDPLLITGRISCSPNVQGVPKTSAARSCFVPAPGMKLVVADYSNAELRILAKITGDKRLTQIFNDGEDPHAIVAADLFDRDEVDDVTPEERKIAKAVNYAIVYGSGSRGLARRLRGQGLDVTDEDAADFMEAFFDRFEGVAEWKEQIEEESPREVRSIMGRVRRFDSDDDVPAKLNSALQSTCADAIKWAMVDLHPRLKKVGARIVACLHDELVVEAPKDRADEVEAMVVEEMEYSLWAFIGPVPVVVDSSIRSTWWGK